MELALVEYCNGNGNISLLPLRPDARAMRWRNIIACFDYLYIVDGMELKLELLSKDRYAGMLFICVFCFNFCLVGMCRVSYDYFWTVIICVNHF